MRRCVAREHWNSLNAARAVLREHGEHGRVIVVADAALRWLLGFWLSRGAAEGRGVL